MYKITITELEKNKKTFKRFKCCVIREYNVIRCKQW